MRFLKINFMPIPLRPRGYPIMIHSCLVAHNIGGGVHLFDCFAAVVWKVVPYLFKP
jgi:hypothetical protein